MTPTPKRAQSLPQRDKSAEPIELLTAGWTPIAVDALSINAGQDTVEISLAAAPTADAPWLVMVQASGPAPVVDSTIAAINGGTDFVHIERS